MCGFIYRMAIRIKEFGERHKLPWLVRLGLWIREQVIKLPARHFKKEARIEFYYKKRAA
jgi:hypothetical protein